ncbi:MAG: gamma-glutamylcyclotransferase, partial [Lentisphaeria bacterium]|nr:gamma-glutamylcyclotransferase [Lentisphaeria bacterium]
AAKFKELGADILFVEAPKSVDEMRTLCAELPGPKMANIVEGGETPDLSPEELQRLDAFEDEGNLYFRRVVVVRTADNRRRRCMTYVGNIPALQKAFGKEILFEDRYSLYLERKIDQLIETIDPDRREITRRALRELMGSAVDSLIESHFDGN